MKKEEFFAFEKFISLFDFVSVPCGEDELVLLKSCGITKITEPVEDKTAFEAVQNHVHLFDFVKSDRRGEVCELSKKLGQLLLSALKQSFPEKHFVVFVTIDREVIIRFHQSRKEEPWYYITDDENAYDSKLLCFEG